MRNVRIKCKKDNLFEVRFFKTGLKLVLFDKMQRKKVGAISEISFFSKLFLCLKENLHQKG